MARPGVSGFYPVRRGTDTCHRVAAAKAAVLVAAHVGTQLTDVDVPVSPTLNIDAAAEQAWQLWGDGSAWQRTMLSTCDPATSL